MTKIRPWLIAITILLAWTAVPDAQAGATEPTGVTAPPCEWLPTDAEAAVDLSTYVLDPTGEFLVGPADCVPLDEFLINSGVDPRGAEAAEGLPTPAPAPLLPDTALPTP